MMSLHSEDSTTHIKHGNICVSQVPNAYALSCAFNDGHTAFGSHEQGTSEKLLHNDQQAIHGHDPLLKQTVVPNLTRT